VYRKCTDVQRTFALKLRALCISAVKSFMPKITGYTRLAAFSALLAATLACNTVEQLVRLEGPEDAATDAFLPAVTPTRRPTLTPRPTSTSPTPKATPTPLPTLAPTLGDFSEAAAMRPDFAGDVDQFPKATRYTIEVTVSFNADGSATLVGREYIRFTNPQDTPLDELYLMLWPNEPNQYLSTMTLRDVRVDGEAIEFELEHGGLAARLPLKAPLAPGAGLEVSSAFAVDAFPGIDELGAARFGLTNGVLLAPTFYPLIPRFTAEGEWQTDPAPVGGDTTNSDTALYEWRVTAPGDMKVVATGSVVETEREADTQTQTLVTGPVRDLALVVGSLELTQREVGGVMLNAYVLPDHAEFADDLLDYAAGQMETLQNRVGPYPFAELDIVDAPGAFGGIEYPAVIFIGVVGGGDFFERATVHEVGHQWFYSLIGDDQLLEPWLDEAAASYTEVLYLENTYGRQAADDALSDYRSFLESADHPELPIGLPVGDYSEGSYGLIVYVKGTLFFDALRQQLGDEVFFDFLHQYYDRYRYGFVTSTDFQAVAEAACACDLEALFEGWVYTGGLEALPTLTP